MHLKKQVNNVHIFTLIEIFHLHLKDIKIQTVNCIFF